MQDQFIRLQQGTKFVIKYVVDFLRLSQFAPYMVTDEKKQLKDFNKD